MATETTAHHSPLPWAVGERNGTDAGASCGIECADWTIADMWADVDELTPAIARANAEFIVTAVNCHAELLAALKGAIETIKSWHSIHDFDDAAWEIYREHAPEMKRINAAIARAESRT